MLQILFKNNVSYYYPQIVFSLVALFRFLFVFVFICYTSLSFAKVSQQIIQINNSQQLYAAISIANKSGNVHLVLLDGFYSVQNTLHIKGDHITLSSKSGNRHNVVISGQGMRKSREINNLIRVSGKYFTLDGITLQQAGNHLIQIAGEHNADFPTIKNCVLKDSYEQLFKVSYNRKTKISSDNGLIENCEFTYTAGIGPQFYIGGIDVHGGHNWIVRNNFFSNIASPSRMVAEHAIHFWNNTKNILVEKNTIVDCDRGIGFGLDNRPTQGGIITGNLILHSNNAHPFADSGIIIEESPNTQVINNKIFLAHNYTNAIEYRFPSTINTLISGNLTNKSIRKRNGAKAILSNNTFSKDLSDYLSNEELKALSFEPY
jgi:hypothetical protein